MVFGCSLLRWSAIVLTTGIKDRMELQAGRRSRVELFCKKNTCNAISAYSSVVMVTQSSIQNQHVLTS